MKRTILLVALVVSGCCDACPGPPYHNGTVVEQRNIAGHTITSFSDGTVEFGHDHMILGFSTEAGQMHDIAMAFEQVSYNAVKRRKAFLDMRFPKRGGQDAKAVQD